MLYINKDLKNDLYVLTTTLKCVKWLYAVLMHWEEKLYIKITDALFDIWLFFFAHNKCFKKQPQDLLFSYIFGGVNLNLHLLLIA